MYVEVIMKESLISDNKKFLNGLFENLIFEWTVSATEVRNLLKVLAIETGSLIYFSSLVINEGMSLLFCFIDTDVFIPYQVFFISLMSSLKKFVEYFSLNLLRSVDKRFL